MSARDRGGKYEKPALREGSGELNKLVGHPKGTLAIVLIYGALFAVGWVALYLLTFVPRGTPQP